MADSMDTVNPNTAPEAEPECHPTMAKFESVAKHVRELSELGKTLEACIRSLGKDMKKICKKRRKTNGSPSNLLKPIAISNDLADIFGKPRGTLMPRGHITSAMNKYAIDNGIKKPGDGRIIVVNEVLSKILNLPVGSDIRIFKVAGQLAVSGHIRTSSA